MSATIDYADEDQSISIMSINDDFQTIDIYLLWNSKIDDEFKIHGLFGESLRYELEPIERFRSELELETIVYRMQYKIPMNNEEYGNIIAKYRLKMLTKTRSISVNYDDIKQRIINVNIPSQFLFDVQFQNHLLSSPKGSPVEFWSQLCLYTYFLIKNNMHENFDCFIHQFRNEFNSNDTRKLTQHQLNMFFYVSYTYLPQINSYLKADKNAVKIILRIFGILPIDKENFKIDNKSLGSLASELYDYIKIHLDDLLTTTDQNDWLEFIQGLSLFMTAQMLGNQTIFNTFILLEQMINHREKQELIANLLLKRIVELQMPIKNDSWINLLPLVTDKYLLYNCLDLVASLDDYLVLLQYIIKHNSVNEQMQVELTKNFDKLIDRGDFLISLENILSLLTHLQPQYKSPTCSSAEDLRMFQLIIKSSNSLRYKIKHCLENLDLNKISLESLCELFQLDHFVAIILIDKRNYLIGTIVNQQYRTKDFYTTWFICFLCDKYYQANQYEQQNFQHLLNVWLEYIQNDRDMLPQIIAKLDILIEHLQTILIDDTDNRLLQFIENMITVCFQPNIIYQIIIDICTKVTNQTFLHCYEKQFIDDLLVNNANRLKLMDDPHNPLYHLLELSKIVDPTNNVLLTNLFTACSKLIKLNNEEIRYETFVHPSKKSCVYAVLFVQYINDYNLYKGLLNHLDSLWNRWTHSGLTISDINIWKNYSSNEQNAFQQIWEYVRKHFNKRESIDKTFKKTELEYQEKMNTRQSILSVLNIYCDKAIDYSHAIISLRDMLQEFDEKPIQSIEIPKDLKDIKSMACKLYPFSLSQVWIHYYNRSFIKIEKSGSQSNSSLKSFESDSEDEIWTSRKSSSVSVSNLPSSSFVTYVKPSRDNLTLIEILNNVDKTFEEFHNHLKHVCNAWRNEPIYKWIQLFSDIENIHPEVEILKSNLHLRITTELIEILNLWKQRDFISHVCQGVLHLLTQLDFPLKEDDLNVLKTLAKLDENILGGQCSLIYQDYFTHYVSHYSSNALIIWSQFSIANELIDFIKSMSSTDFDHLLENVNDWDEKLVSGKTVIDYSMLKHYFDQVDKFIEQLQAEKNRYSLPNILACFDNIDTTNQFGNVEEFFAACSTELSNMRHSHSELVDKEQCKRRQIIDIMQNSFIDFLQLPNFDVLVSPYKINFFDLNELRDRARLIGYSYSNKMKKDDEYQMKIFELFIKFVDTIESILNTLISLYIAGHPIISKIIMIKQVFHCEENQFDELIGFNEKMQEIFLAWEKTLFEKYITYPELTYFSCEQFDMIEKFIYHKSECDEEEYGYHLLKYIGLEPKLIRQLNLVNDKQQTAEDRLENIGRILSNQRSSINNLSQENRMNKKIFIIETTDDEILRAILSLYHRFNAPPIVSHLFYCTNQTNWMEIRAFICRCIYSQQLHQLIRPEHLSLLIQNQIIHLIRQIIEEEPQYAFRLGIITTVPIVNLQLIDGLKSLQIVEIVQEQDLMNSAELRANLSNLIQKCIIVTSRITGLGKSHTIRAECTKIHRECIKFPINGDIQPDLIAKRLLKVARKFQNGAIHFDIGVVDNYRQINDLITCLVLFRSFCFGQIAISIPVETPIYIELDSSSHSNLIKHVILFQHIPSIFINQIDWQKLVLTKSVQFVASYLKAIKDKTIAKQDVTLKDLTVNDCVKLLQGYFFNAKNQDYITWTQLFIHISIYYKLFLGFSECCHFQMTYLYTDQLRKSRIDILQAFLNSANQFTSISLESVRKQQRTNKSNDNHQEQELNNVIIRWDKIQPFTIIFSSENVPIFIYKTDKDVPQSLKIYFYLYNQQSNPKQSKDISSKEQMIVSNKTFFPDYKQLTHEELFKKLAKLSKKYLNKAICTKCFRQYDYETLTCKHCFDTTDVLERPYPTLNDEDTQAFQNRIAKIIESEYVITADNYIKMLLVFLRVQSGVPVLIMGETGCGKTALINCLCRKILDDDLYIFRLHAGITDEKLIEEMNHLIIQAENIPSKKHLWIFFDEFNTIFNISLLKEIVCERTMLGKALPKNMVFLGTCNPRREKCAQASFHENIGIEKDSYQILKLNSHRQSHFYTVRQIPETMLEYIWDYGYLDQDTEKTYIQATLRTCEGLSNDIEWFRNIVELISESHVYLRELEDISSVSLRDVARYCRLYKWFNQYLVNIDNNSNRIQRASLIALLLCYYFRLDSKEKKQMYLERLGNHWYSVYKRSKSYFVKYLEKILEKEEIRLINQMQLPNDMALNRALKENIFVLFSCIINRIPVFLCGKPGASKTSAVQILMNNLKGLRSDNIFFRRFPELVPVTFQGSQSCTSKHIEQVFQRAEKYMKIQTNSSLLPVIIFDEIGLAELSIYNPLKVLHEQLELEQCRFGFVGISNWCLDAAKMNRALYVACVDPDDEDLELTGLHLSKLKLVSQQTIEFDPNIIRGLAQAYFDLQKRMKKEHRHENYFGLRDYYSLIKGIVYNCQKYPNRSQYEIIYQQLVINFGGINTGYEYIWEKFCSLIGLFDNEFPTPNPKKLIEQSLTNRNSRYLMLIIDRESTIDHVERYISTNPILNGSVKTLVGSHFEGDFVSNGTYSESYSTRVLMEIILHAETPITLVMRRMNHLYDNLYDLFNQNFAISGRKKYCRIALSSIYNPRCFVNDNFYCVILLNEKDVNISDPPFLNRFEKHYIKIDELIPHRELSLTSQLSNWLLELPLPKFSKHFPLLKHLIIPYNPDYICDLVMDISQDQNLTDEIVLNSCKAKLIRASSFDFPLVLSLDNNEDLIEQYYQTHNQLLNISQLISSKSLSKCIIYTYTNVHDTIDYENCENISEIKLSNIKTELELINLLKTSNENKTSSSILLIRVDYHRENQHILSLKYNLLNHSNELKDLNLWIIFHIQRNKLNQIETDVIFNGWDIIMIDDLNNRNKFISKDILVNPSYQYFIENYQMKFIDEFFQEFIHRALAKFRYENLLNEQRYDLFNYQEDQFFRGTLRETIQYFIKAVSNPDQTRFQDWRCDLISNNYITITSQSFNEALQSIMIIFYDSYFQLLFHHFESFNLIDSYLYLQENQSIDLRSFWFECYKFSLNTIDNSMMNDNFIEICLINDLKLPYSTKENKVLQKIRDVLQEKLGESIDDIDVDDLELIIIDLLKEKSSYGEKLIGYLLDNNELLDLYYHDQLILFHMENKFQFSTKFTLKLMTSNVKCSTMNRLIRLIAYPEELSEILRIFEDGFKLLDENILLDCMNKQFFVADSLECVSNSFYSIVLKDETFHLVLPNTLQIENEFEFDPRGDPFIAITVMNLIEFIVCPDLISKIENIEQIAAMFSSINQSIFKLTQYEVINLEKLRSFMSFLRCITTLNPSKALKIFQQCCKDDKFDASFQTCDHIHQFIQNLEKYIMQQQGSMADETSIKSTLLKLEIEFLKNWLVDHDDQYPSILCLISQTENNLWRYSAKIFSFIVGKLDLLTNIESSYEQTQDESDEINQLKEHLNTLPKFQHKIHRLFVNRMHLDLILRSPIDNHLITNDLSLYYENFEKSVQCINLIISSEEYSHVKLIRVLCWLKYYTQLYSFALINSLKFDRLDDIDQYLTNNKSSFCSTLKLFIFKQILNISKTDVNTFRNDLKYRNVTWLKEFFEDLNEEKTRNHRNLIPPIPLLEMQDEYMQINKILNDLTDQNSLEDLIFRCSTKQNLSYCFYLWFIKHYIQYSTKNFQSDDFYRDLFANDLSDRSKTFLQPIGIRFLHLLCTNFSSNSYFHLNPSMSDRDISIRLVILNIFALTLSFKSFPDSNWLNTILFNINSTMPMNYFEHLQSLCLFGLIHTNEIVSNMKHVRASVQQQLNSGHLKAAGKYIYQCSQNCLYLFHFTDCGIPNARSQCLFCGKDIGSSKYGVLIERNPPQIKMTIEKGFQLINEYIEKFDRENKYGYHQVVSSNQSTLEEKSDYLNSPISYRFLHLFLHSILLVLKEFNYLSNENLQQWNIQSEEFFQNHVEKDYELLEKCILDSQCCYIWLFQLLNRMVNGFVVPLGMLDSKEKVIQLEKIIEQQLIIPQSVLKIERINNYKRAYTEYAHKEESDNTIINYVDERTENNRRYPLLNFFNITQIFNQNRLKEYFLSLKTMAHAKQNYPLSMYLLEQTDLWSNIQHLYPIIQFLNYIRDKYNYRIRRQEAVGKSIQECLCENDDKKGEDLFKKFSDSWSKINLTEVRYDCQLRTFDRHMTKDKKLAFFSLNASKDDSGLILSATLQTIGRLQNNIVNYYHNEIVKSTNIRQLAIHKIEHNNLLRLDMNYINAKILKHSLVINFEYGQGKDIIYDYEEIEMTLRSLINRLPLINTNKFRKIQYQFELYSENNSLINNSRYHIEQKPINDDQRKQYRCILENKDGNDILQYLGSLDYIFTYIQNRNYRSDISTIELFVEQYIHSTVFLNKNLFLQSTFSSIRLEYIIDLYELIEEIAFDKTFRNHIEEKLNSQSIENDEQKELQDKFCSMTIDSKQIAFNLQNIHQWISTLKRFMVRILPDYIDLNIPIEIYLKRTDLWNSQITKEDLETIQLDDNILLKHTYIILIGLENRLNESKQRTRPITIVNSTKEREKADSFETSLSPNNIVLDKPRTKKSIKRYRDT